MNSKLQEMATLATGVMHGVLIASNRSDTAFKDMVDLADGGKLLVVGSVHRDFDDGYCVAVLDADEALVDQLRGGLAYVEPLLREMVRGRCKAMAMVTCIGRKGFLTAQYLARRH